MSESSPPTHPPLQEGEGTKQINKEEDGKGRGGGLGRMGVVVRTLTGGIRTRFPRSIGRIRERDRDCGSDICKQDQV